ncbi:MAG: 23S rRNA (uracil(1939)-C(5))-methyltransferase RlmD [Bacilli bacterium]|nr:23S rRNA (uracil(1939)-C(5))-methyltransferase RlmD [Bacilli bacterium]
MTENIIHKTYNLSCVDLSTEGKGICKLDGLVVFVPAMFPGDEGEVEIDYKRNGQYFGVLRKLTTLSPDRITPLCKVSSACGGCVFQQYAYKAELEYKRRKVEDQIKRFSEINIDVLPTLGMEEPINYRNKIQVPFGKNDKGKAFYGFYKEGTHCIVPRKECFIEDKRAQKILDSLTKILNELHIEPYDEHSESGSLRYAMIRTSFYKKQIMLVLVTKDAFVPKKPVLIDKLLKECPEITSLVQNVNSEKTNVILGRRFINLYGPGYIEDSLCGVKFKISAESFYQTNPKMTEILYKTAMDFAELSKNDVVLDAYSGIGTIGLIAASKVKRVISVELVEEAVKDAIKNAKNNNIKNFEAYNDDATLFISRMAKRKERLDVLFMDPPRKGSTEKFLKAAMALEPSKIIYVSCNPSTLARDLKILKAKYKLEKVQPVDEFGRSYHVETVAALSLKTKK